MTEEERMQLNHSTLLGTLTSDVASAHKRMDNLDLFVIEMRKMGKSMIEMNGNVAILASEIKTISKTLVKHEGEIESIQSKMETKEGMARLYKTVEDILLEQKSLDERLLAEETKEAREALSAMNKIKWWLMGSVGAILLALIMIYLGLK